MAAFGKTNVRRKWPEWGAPLTAFDEVTGEIEKLAGRKLQNLRDILTAKRN